jgi:hypothetical protein
MVNTEQQWIPSNRWSRLVSRNLSFRVWVHCACTVIFLNIHMSVSFRDMISEMFTPTNFVQRIVYRQRIKLINMEAMQNFDIFLYRLILYRTLMVSKFFVLLWIYTQTVGLLGRVISPSQGLYLNTWQHKHWKTHKYTKHPCPKWFMP